MISKSDINPFIIVKDALQLWMKSRTFVYIIVQIMFVSTFLDVKFASISSIDQIYKMELCIEEINIHITKFPPGKRLEC